MIGVTAAPPTTAVPDLIRDPLAAPHAAAMRFRPLHGEWAPAFAGTTREGAGMTQESAGVTQESAEVTNVGILTVDYGQLFNRYLASRRALRGRTRRGFMLWA